MVLRPKARITKIGCILFMVILCYCAIFLVVEQPTAEYFNKSFSKNITVYIDNKSAILLPSSICAGYSHIVTIVTSAPNHFELRNAIRETWGSITRVEDRKITTYFILGRPNGPEIKNKVKEESQIYDDIVLENFEDTYYNLTIKSLMLLKTAHTHCLHSTKYIFKVDDDVFLNWDYVMQDLKPYDRLDYLLMGYEFVRGTVERRFWDKWYVPRSVYKSATYPSFLSGNAYIFTVNLVPKLLETAVEVPLFHLEDVYITGFLVERLNLTLTDNSRFRTRRVANLPCHYINVTTSHYNEVEDFKILFDMIYGIDDLETQCRNYRSL